MPQDVLVGAFHDLPVPNAAYPLATARERAFTGIGQTAKPVQG
jgi:hypothetical protein